MTTAVEPKRKSLFSRLTCAEGRTLRRAVLISCCLLLSLLSFWLFRDRQQKAVLINGFVYETLGILFLISQRGSKSTERRLTAAMVLLWLAEMPAFLEVALGFPSIPFATEVSEALYTGFMALMCLYLGAALRLQELRRRDLALLFVSGLIFLGLTTKYVLWPFYLRPDTPSVFHLVNSTIYRFVEATAFAVAFNLAVRVVSVWELVFTHSVVLVCVASCALSYSDGVVRGDGYPLHAYGWVLALMGFWAAFVMRPPGVSWSANFDRIDGIRAKLASVLFGFNALLFGAVVLLRLYEAEDAFQVTTGMFVLFAFWLLANGIALSFSRRLVSILEQVLADRISPSAMPAESKLCSTFDLRRLGIHELDALMERHRTVVLEHEALREKAVQEELEKAGLKSRAEQAAQVAHDIRSPLAALTAADRELAQLPESTRTMIRLAIGRIRDIAEQLAERGRTQTRGRVAQERGCGRRTELLLPLLVDALVIEKQTQFRSRDDIKIDWSWPHDVFSLFVNAERAELMRAISNVINNAVEALPGGGVVLVRVYGSDAHAIVTIEDNGCGIPAEFMARIGKRGETFGKANGTGLGLAHAISTLEGAGGRLELDSVVGRGTVVRLTLPRQKAPSWFQPAISLPLGGVVIVADDDQLIHEVWSRRLESFNGTRVSLIHAKALSELPALIGRHACREGVLLLVDHEFRGEVESGLGCIERLRLHRSEGLRVVLVTGQYEDESLLLHSQRLGVRVLPKGLVGAVPVEAAPWT